MKDILWVKPPMQTAVGFSRVIDAVHFIERLLGEVSGFSLNHDKMTVNGQEWTVFMGDKDGNKINIPPPDAFYGTMIGESKVNRKMGGVKARTIINTLSTGFINTLRYKEVTSEDFEGVIEFLLSTYMKFKEIPPEKRRKRMKEINEFMLKIRKFQAP